MSRLARVLRPAVLAGWVAAVLAVPVTGAPLDEESPTAPLSGVLRADGVPLAGVSLVVRGISGAAASVVKILTTDAEGTFCLAEARPGVYSVLAAVPGFRSASARILHRATAETLSFVRLDLDRERRGVLPGGPGGALDPWAARAVLAGDVLREEGPVEREPGAEAPEKPAVAASSTAKGTASLPVQGAVSSLQGFAPEGSSARSLTSVDVRGDFGGGVKWGLSGEYDRVTSSEGGRLGGASRVELDVLPSEGHSIRVASHRSEIPSLENPDARLDAHSVDWAASPGKRSKASVSARILSHRNLEPGAPPSPLFHGEGRALEVDARYRGDLGSGRFVRVHAGYRSDLPTGSTPGTPGAERAARVGAVAGLPVFDVLLVEAGGTGDTSLTSRGVTPEMTLSLEALRGLTVYGFAARRLEERLDGSVAAGIVGIDPADLVRATRALYRAGMRFENSTAGRIEVEASRREISEAFQLLLDTDVVDRLDALYLFPGDVADMLSGSVTFAVKANVAAKLAVLGGRVQGDGATSGALPNDARWVVSSARVDVRPSGTSVAVRYRLLEQEMGVSEEAYRNGHETVDVTLAQEIPIPILRAFGSRWQALFSVGAGSRRTGEAERRQNRQMAGGLSLSF